MASATYLNSSFPYSKQSDAPFFSQSNKYSLNLDFYNPPKIPQYFLPDHVFDQFIKESSASFQAERFTMLTPKLSEEAQPSSEPRTNSSTATDDSLYIGPLVLGAGDLIADLAGKTSDVYNQILWFQGAQDPVGLVGLEVTSIFSIVKGACTASEGIRQGKVASKIKDLWGQVLAALKTMRGTISTVGGTIALPARMLTMVSLSSTAGAVTAAAGALSKVSGSLFSLLGFLYFATYGINIYLQYNFDQELASILDVADGSKEQKELAALEMLKAKLKITDEERAQICSEVEARPLTEAEKTAKIGRKLEKLTKKKEAELKRVTSKACLDLIKNADNLAASSVIETVLEQTKENMILNGIGMAISVLSIVAMMIVLTCTGGAPLIAAAAIGTVVMLALFVVDLYYLWGDFNASEPGRYDRLCLLISSAIGFAVLSVAIFFAASWIALTCAAIFGLIWLIINLTCYWRLRHLEAKTA